MSKKRRKTTSCFNCETPLNNRENYCPSCGQENHHKQASVVILIRDFLGDSLSFDSKLFKSLAPLVLQPGVMTEDYLNGKRQKFVPPIRLFLFLSFIYFGLSLLLFQEWTGSVTLNGEVATGKAAEEFGEAMRNNMNLLFFLFTPIQALIIMIWYRSKERKYYVNFFVYSLHLFSLLFVMGTVIETLDWLFTGDQDFMTVFDWILFAFNVLLIAYFLVYTVVSLKRVFKKKNNILLFIITLIMSLIAFIVVSLIFILSLGWMYNMFTPVV